MHTQIYSTGSHVYTYKHTLDPHIHRHTEVCGVPHRPALADPTISIPFSISSWPSPLAGTPSFSPSLPSAPHQAKNRLTHCSSRGNRHGHLSPNLTQSLGLTSPRKWEHQSTPCKMSKALIQHGGDKTLRCGCRHPKN